MREELHHPLRCREGAAGVFNGTTGVVTGMSLEDHALTVRTDQDEEIGYDFDELDELAHAYALEARPGRLAWPDP
jgi:ATP-dependent exoDNAse (exonuclease V) alpha subunit